METTPPPSIKTANAGSSGWNPNTQRAGSVVQETSWRNTLIKIPRKELTASVYFTFTRSNDKTRTAATGRSVRADSW